MTAPKITAQEVKEIYTSHGADINDRDLQSMADDCNQNAMNGIRNLTAHGWAHRWAREDANEQRCDGLALDKFQQDAFGDD